MNIQSGFSFKFLVQYRSMKIKGKNIEVDLQVGLVKVIKSTSSCPDLGQSLNQRAVSPTASAYIMSTRTKVYHYRIQYTYTRVRSPKALQRVGCVTAGRRPFFPRRRRQLQIVHVTQPHGISLKIPTHEWTSARSGT
jgi:hypothetical protein